MNLVEYELVFLAKPDLDDSVYNEIVARAEAVIDEAEGAIFLKDHWGRKRLAYDIGTYNKAYYALLMFAAPTAVIGKVERALRLDERVLRYMTVRLADKVDVEAKKAWGVVRAEELRKEREERARIEAERAAERERSPGRRGGDDDMDDDDMDDAVSSLDDPDVED